MSDIEALTEMLESVAHKLESPNASASVSAAGARAAGGDSQGSGESSLMQKLAAVRSLKKKEGS